MSTIAPSRYRHGLLRRGILGYPPALIGTIVISFFVLLAILAPVLMPFDPNRVVGAPLVPPGGEYLLGTDALGRDVFSNLLNGGRISLLVGFAAGAAVFVLGAIVGGIAGYFGGRTDMILMRVTEVFQVIPSLILALVTVAIIGRGVFLIAAAIALSIWPQVARVVRGEVMAMRESDLVSAARTTGFSNGRILVREIAPNILAPVFVTVTIEIGAAILIEAGLSFLGLGDPTQASWGQMLQRAQSNLGSWWLSVPPGAAILAVVLSINFIGDGLSHALRPARKENL